MDIKNAVKYHYDQFPPKEINYNNIVNHLVKATEALAKYDQMLKNLHNSEILLAPLRNQEAVLSSRMEGTISTMDEILTYEANVKDDKEDSKNFRSDIFETILYQRALKNAQNAMNDGYPISNHLIKSIHQQLLSFGRGAHKSPGKYKTEQNYLADRIKQEILFVPISPEKLNDGLEILFKYLNESQDPVLIKTALMHLEFEALHPFQDGNGRIGRMLITLYLWSSKTITHPHFYISGYFEENKNKYINLMKNVSENGDWEKWCIFFLNAIENQALKNLETADKIKNLYEEMKKIFAETLSSKWFINALDFIFTYPIFRNSSFNSKAGIPISTSNRFCKKLLERDILKMVEKSNGRRPYLYSFEPLMKIVRV